MSISEHNECVVSKRSLGVFVRIKCARCVNAGASVVVVVELDVKPPAHPALGGSALASSANDRRAINCKSGLL